MYSSNIYFVIHLYIISTIDIIIESAFNGPRLVVEAVATAVWGQNMARHLRRDWKGESSMGISMCVNIHRDVNYVCICV
jgi:hypothetical protein